MLFRTYLPSSWQHFQCAEAISFSDAKDAVRHAGSSMARPRHFRGVRARFRCFAGCPSFLIACLSSWPPQLWRQFRALKLFTSSSYLHFGVVGEIPVSLHISSFPEKREKIDEVLCVIFFNVILCFILLNVVLHFRCQTQKCWK